VFLRVCLPLNVRTASLYFGRRQHIECFKKKPVYSAHVRRTLCVYVSLLKGIICTVKEISPNRPRCGYPGTACRTNKSEGTWSRHKSMTCITRLQKIRRCFWGHAVLERLNTEFVRIRRQNIECFEKPAYLWHTCEGGCAHMSAYWRRVILTGRTMCTVNDINPNRPRRGYLGCDSL
jgi:hypothetical protein